MDFRAIVHALETSLDFAVATGAHDHLFVRGGVVCSRASALVILGPRGSGTSSLVAALVRAGATLCSDRFAVFDRDGRVLPYRKAATLASNGSARAGPTASFEHSAATPTPVRQIIVTRYSRGSRWRPRELSRGQSVLALLEQTVLARIRPDRALAVLQHVARGARTRSSLRGDAAAIAAGLLNELGVSNA